MAVPAIYTPQLVDALRVDLEAAEVALKTNRGKGRSAAMFAERLRFTRASFEMIDAYVATARAAARDADYTAAASAGQQSLEAQHVLRAANPLFVSGLIGGEEKTPWLAGEVQQYRELKALTDGSRGTLVARLALDWAFKVEKPLPAEWRYNGPEGAVPRGDGRHLREQPSAANGWQIVRTDLYLQGQGVIAADGQSHLGHYWYRTAVALAASDPNRKLRLMFPGLLNEAWLYVNGELVAHRDYKEPWWSTDYRFEWDVNISKYVHPGVNEIALRGFNPHHMGGIFRRPFLYEPH